MWAEQRMIESLGDHGVDPSDLVPALMTTHTVKNPEYDPVARKRKDLDEAARDQEDLDSEGDAPPAYEVAQTPKAEEKVHMEDPIPSYSEPEATEPMTTPRIPTISPVTQTTVNPFGDEDEGILSSGPPPKPVSSRTTSTSRPGPSRLSSFNADDDDGDIGRSVSPSASHMSLPEQRRPSKSPSTPPTPILIRTEPEHDPEKRPPQDHRVESPTPEKSLEEDFEMPEEQAPLPSLPGVSTKMSTTDEVITLDIRWTVVSRPRMHILRY